MQSAHDGSYPVLGTVGCPVLIVQLVGSDLIQ